VEVFSQVEEDEFQEWLDKVIDIVQKQPCKHFIVNTIYSTCFCFFTSDHEEMTVADINANNNID